MLFDVFLLMCIRIEIMLLNTRKNRNKQKTCIGTTSNIQPLGRLLELKSTINVIIHAYNIKTLQINRYK